MSSNVPQPIISLSSQIGHEESEAVDEALSGLQVDIYSADKPRGAILTLQCEVTEVAEISS